MRREERGREVRAEWVGERKRRGDGDWEREGGMEGEREVWRGRDGEGKREKKERREIGRASCRERVSSPV